MSDCPFEGLVIETEHGPYRITGYSDWSNGQYLDLEAIEKPKGLAKFRTTRATALVRETLGMPVPPPPDEDDEDAEEPDDEAPAFVCGRFVLLSTATGSEAYVTSWDGWAEAEAAAWPLEDGFIFEDAVAGMRLYPGATEWVPVERTISA